MEVPFVDIVKILHSGEGGDVEQCLELETNSLMFAIDFFFLFIALHSYTCDTICLPFQYCIHLIFLHFWSLLISTRKQLSTLTHHLEESNRRSSRALHWEFGFNFLFWVTACFFSSQLVLKVHLISITPIHPPLGVFRLVLELWSLVSWPNNLREILNC